MRTTLKFWPENKLVNNNDDERNKKTQNGIYKYLKEKYIGKGLQKKVSKNMYEQQNTGICKKPGQSKMSDGGYIVHIVTLIRLQKCYGNIPYVAGEH